jgi:glycosyltransferase involved in cell wall biosynthesis
MKLPISVVMVIANEEELVERALCSCADLVDDIVIVHDGPCTDASLEICKKYTDRIFVLDCIGQAEPHRVFTYAAARHDWVLQLDADEFLSAELRSSLRSLVSDPRYHGYAFLWPTYYRGRYYYAYHKLALVNRKHFYFIGVPHENWRPLSARVRTRELEIVLEHKPRYDNLTFAVFKTKWVRWAKIHAGYYTRDFHTLTTYRCPLSGWEPRTKLRIEHPLLLGILGSFVAHFSIGLLDFLRKRQMLFLKSGLFMGLYHVVLYYELCKQRRRRT